MWIEIYGTFYNIDRFNIEIYDEEQRIIFVNGTEEYSLLLNNEEWEKTILPKIINYLKN